LAAESEEARNVSDVYDDLPVFEPPEPLEREDAADVAPLDSEIDFDDEADEDQLPIDEVEARETGVWLDDPELLSSPEDG
jgi:hypothetical protein